MQLNDALPRSVRPTLWRTIVTLFKLRIVALLLLASFGGAALAAAAHGQYSGLGLLVLTLCGGLAAAGASALNQYLERAQDQQMSRTARRPFAAQEILNAREVAWAAGGMVVFAVALAAWYSLPLAFWVLAGAVIYVGVYTIWLKPRTSLNIVIGGAAGSCAVISGGAAMGDWLSPGVWLLAGLLFVWTPVHFWSLAFAYREQYAQAAFPMLPVMVSPGSAARWTALHTLLTAGFALTLAIWPRFQWPLLLPIALATAYLIRRTIPFVQRPSRETALALFHTSNIYLALILAVIIIAGAIQG